MKKQESSRLLRPVNDGIYDLAYLEEYNKRSNTEIGKALYLSRWQYVRSYAPRGVVIDYGCANGAFHESCPYPGYEAYGYDVNPFSKFNKKPDVKKVDTLTMWDVIEHLVVPVDPIVEYAPEWVFISTPNIDAAEDVATWRHFKPGEHLHYFNLKSLIAILRCAGYTVLNFNYEEGKIRDPECPANIISVVAKRGIYEA